MQILECLGQLIDDESDMHILEDVLSDDIMQISLHELKKEVDVAIVVGLYSFIEFYYVGVIQLPQDLYFPVGSLCVC